MSETRQLQLLRLAAGLSFLLALVNHLLPPKAFAASQLLFDYQFGLARRGLLGAILNPVTGVSVSVQEIYATAALVTFLGAASFYWFLWRSMTLPVAGWLLLILALNSFAFASFVGNTGYLDGVLLVLVIAALASNAASATGLAIRLGVVVLGVLVHENMLPYFAVLLGFDLWLARKDKPLALIFAALPVAVAFLAVGLLAAFAEFSPDQAVEYASYLQGKAGFGLDSSSTDVAGRTIGQNFTLMEGYRGTTKYLFWLLFDGVPLLLMAVWLCWLGFRLLGPDAGLGRILLAGAIFAPLSLNFIAFDVVRFGVASVLAGFLLLALLLRHVEGAQERLSAVLNWPHFLVVLVLNVNIFTIQINEGAGHLSQFPWVLINQLKWLSP